jgi:hypothetical protein
MATHCRRLQTRDRHRAFERESLLVEGAGERRDSRGVEGPAAFLDLRRLVDNQHACWRALRRSGLSASCGVGQIEIADRVVAGVNVSYV